MRFGALALFLAVAQGGKPDESDAFFRSGQVPRLVIELDSKATEALKAEPRIYAMGQLRENERTLFEEVAFKLKGAAGSFRELDDTPSFTVKMDRGDDDQKFHGLRKFHLNKSVQDETYLRELIGSDLCKAAGVLAPRVTHARVWINKRDMGLYVLKEAFDRTLLKRGFEKSGGSLYDGGFCQDVDADLEKDEGKDVDDRKELKALLEACREPDLVKRWARMPELVDMKAFLTFMAMELMLGHWDGYCLNRNNYRLYFDPATKKAHFFPHGMDQVLQDADASILDGPAAIVASAVMRNPTWRQDFRKRVGELLPLFAADRLKRRIDDLEKRLEPLLQAWDKDRAAAHQASVAGLKSLIEAREKSLKEQNGMPDPRPLVFTLNTPVLLTRWRTNSECEDAALATSKAGNVELLTIACGKSGKCIASWRRGVLVPQGKYKLQALIQATDVKALEDDAAKVGVGAGLRLSGSSRENKLVGTCEFKAVELEFEVTEQAADVELVIELRASKGSIAIRTDSVRLTKVGK